MIKMWKHQQEAFDKLVKLKVGALFMEMGTGKTLVSIMLADYRLSVGKIDKVVVIVKKSLVLNFKKEI